MSEMKEKKKHSSRKSIKSNKKLNFLFLKPAQNAKVIENKDENGSGISDERLETNADMNEEFEKQKKLFADAFASSSAKLKCISEIENELNYNYHKLKEMKKIANEQKLRLDESVVDAIFHYSSELQSKMFHEKYERNASLNLLREEIAIENLEKRIFDVSVSDVNEKMMVDGVNDTCG